MSDVQTAAQPNVSSHGGYVNAPTEFVNHHSASSSSAEGTAQKVEQQPAGATTNQEEKVSKKDVKITAEPVTSGVLGYKAPGIISALKSFKNHYFWLGDEPVHHKHLTQYLRGEKQQDAAHANAAWSSQTGKGLLYFSKSESDKKTPGGLLNLSEVYEVAKEGVDEFSFRLHKHKHVFKAKNQEERNGWVVALEQDRETATNTKKQIQESSGYKEHLAQLGGPAALGAAGGSAVAASKVQENRETKAAEPAKDVKEVKEAKDTKSRSVSRGNKRQSILGTIRGKKEEHDEKKEEKKEDKALDKQQKETEQAGASKDKEVEAAALAEGHGHGLTAKSEDKEDKKALVAERKTEAKEAEKSLKADEKAEKQHQKEIKKEESAEKKAAKEHDQHEKKATEAAGAAVAAGGAAAAVEEEHKVKKEEELRKDSTPAKDTSKANKRRSMFGGFFGSKSPEPEKSQQKTEHDKVAGNAEPAAAAAATAGATGASATKTTAPTPENVFANDPVSAEGSGAPAEVSQNPLTGVFADDPVAPVTKENLTPAKSAAAGTSPGEKRRSGFFGLGSMKKSDRASEANAGTDSETTDNEAPKTKQQSSKFGDIFRRPSRTAKSAPAKDAEKKATSTPAPVAEEGTTTAGNKVDTGVAPAAGLDGASEAKPLANGQPKPQASIGDVVPEAVTIGEKQETSAPVSTAA